MLKPLYCCSDYLVSDKGYILSKTKNTPLKYSLNHNGYCIINIMANNNRIGMGIHSAVAKTFLGDFTNIGLEVNHKNGIKTDNRLCNLEWVTSKENSYHSINVLGNDFTSYKNPNHKVVEMINKNNNEVVTRFSALADAAKYFSKKENINQNYAQNGIWRAIYGYRKSYKGYYWKYADVISPIEFNH